MNSKILEEFKNNRNIVSLFTDSEDALGYCSGIILDYDEDYLLFNSIEDGKDDGLMLFNTSDIFRINIDGKHEKKLDSLFDKNNKKEYNLEYKESLLDTVLNYSKENNLVISVCLDYSLFDGYIMGFVSSYDEDTLIIDSYDEFGEADGKTYINIDDIGHIMVLSSSEKALQEKINL